MIYVCRLSLCCSLVFEEVEIRKGMQMQMECVLNIERIADDETGGIVVVVMICKAAQGTRHKTMKSVDNRM